MRRDVAPDRRHLTQSEWVRPLLRTWLVLPARWFRQYVTDRRAQRQICKVCGRTQEVDFVVSDAAWRSVVPRKWDGRVLCLTCFERYAAHQGATPIRIFLPGGP